MKKYIFVFLILCTITNMFPVLAEETAGIPVQQEISVSMDGNDSGKGTKDSPFRTIERAKAEVKKYNSNMRGDIVVSVGQGVFTFSKTLCFDESDGGTNGFNVIYRGVDRNKSILSGGEKINGFEQYKNGIYRSKTSGYDVISELYVNDIPAIRAKSEGYITPVGWYDNKVTEAEKPAREGLNEKDGLLVKSSDVGLLQNPKDILLLYIRGWRAYNVKVENIIPAGEGKNAIVAPNFSFKGITYGNHNIAEDTPFTLINALELLDTPGEFYYNPADHYLYYMPREGEDISKADIYAPRLEKVIDIKGSDNGHKVKNLVFDNLRFSHGTWLQPSKEGMSILQANVLEREKKAANELDGEFIPAAISLNSCENISFTNSRFTQFSAYAMGLYNGVKNTDISGNVFYDIGGAISVGLSRDLFGSPAEDGFNLAAGKPATADVEAPSSQAYMAFDDNPLSTWTTGKFVKVDLGAPYKINRLEVVPKLGSEVTPTSTARKNFEILGSNFSDFSKYVVLATQGNVNYPGSIRTFNLLDDEKYRYVGFRCTDNTAKSLGELRVINTDMPFIPVKELCANISIKNNYFERIGEGLYATPAIQTYYTQNVSISHNTMYDLAYSGICAGWGWDMYKECDSARNTSINYNYIDSPLQRCFDGGAIYTLGNQTNSTIIGNYIKNQPNLYGSIYTDAGTAYYTIMDNVIENTCASAFYQTSLNYYNYTKNTYTTSLNNGMPGKNSVEENIVYFVPDNPPGKAIDIIANAGLEEQYKDLKTSVPKRYKPNGPLYPFENAIYQTKYNSDTEILDGYLTRYVKSAKYWIEKLIVAGTEPGQYPQDSVEAFKNKINGLSSYISEQTKLMDAKVPLDRTVIMQQKLSFDEALRALEAAKVQVSYDELLEKCKKTVTGIKTGINEGQYPQNAYDTFRGFIEYAGGLSDEKKKDGMEYLKLQANLNKFLNAAVEYSIVSIAGEKDYKPAKIDPSTRTAVVYPVYDQDLNGLKINIKSSDYTKLDQSVVTLNLTTPKEMKVYNVDRSDYASWKISAEPQTVISQSQPYKLNSIVDDEMNWNLLNASMPTKIYNNALFGDTAIEFGLKIDAALAGDWPTISFRNQKSDQRFDGTDTSAYCFVINEAGIELHRFNNGNRTVFYGSVTGFKPVISASNAKTNFVFGTENNVKITTRNENKGVRIIIEINGSEVCNFVDDSSNAITKPGYFGYVAPKSPLTLTKVQ